MGWNDSKDDIVLDEEAFDKAINDFADLAIKLQSLRSDIDELLMILKQGFDTPAGRKFIGSCETCLLEPLERQKLVIEHVSATLKDVKGTYSPVFTEYKNLNNESKSYKT